MSKNIVIRQSTDISDKVAAGGVSGAATLLVVYTTGLFGVEVPPEVAAAAVLLVSTTVAYFRADRI
jgi:hypothetical protein